MVSAALILVLVFAAVMLALNAIPGKGYLVSSFVLLFAFMFYKANIPGDLGDYYSMMMLATIMFSLVGVGAKDVSEADIDGKPGPELSGIGFTAAVIGVAAILFGLIRTLQGEAAAQVLGIPPVLAVGGLKQIASPAFIGLLGYPENRAWIGLFDMSREWIAPHLESVVTSLPIPFLPMIPFVAILGASVAMLFGVFHWRAFGATGINANMVLAAVVMGIWLIVAALPLGSEPTSLSHFIHNSDLALEQLEGLIIQT